MNFRKLLRISLLAALCSGCTVVSANRVFPKLTFAWTKDAQMQRAEDKLEKQIRNGEMPK